MASSQKTVIHADARVQQGFAMLPRAVLFNRNLSAGARLLYAALKSYAWQTESCWPGMDALSDGLGVSYNTMKKWRDELSKEGLLHVERKGQGKPSILWIIEPRLSDFEILESHTSETEVEAVDRDLSTLPLLGDLAVDNSRRQGNGSTTTGGTP